MDHSRKVWAVMNELNWKKEADGSYTSEAGRIWRHPGEAWKDCCITLNKPLYWAGGRVGNLRESKELLQRLWNIHMRKTGPLPMMEVMLDAFQQNTTDPIVLALIEAVRGTTMMQPNLHRALGEWWRS